VAWTGTTLIAKWRQLTGRGSTDDISDVNVLVLINDYYQDDFPLEIEADKITADYTATATATDDGEFSLSDSVIDLNRPITANEFNMTLWDDKTLFFQMYPEDRDETFITKPTLTIGTDTAKVLSQAFNYKLSDWVYPKASVETALSGDTVPQNTYGAWLLSIDVDGTITITEAADNATGYATVGLAIQGITLPGSAQSIMGFVTAINTAAAFIPGTTALTGDITATFTDGNPQLRSVPTDACLANGKLYIRPKPFDTFFIRAVSSLTAPTALVAGTSPLDETWGPAIATGAAMKYLSEVDGDTSRISEILGQAGIPGTHQYNISRIDRKRLRQDSEREVIRSF
jgi:hypothetical protein